MAGNLNPFSFATDPWSVTTSPLRDVQFQFDPALLQFTSQSPPAAATVRDQRPGPNTALQFSTGESPEACRYFANGGCQRGDKCPFSHDLTVRPKTGEDESRGFVLSGKVQNLGKVTPPLETDPEDEALLGSLLKTNLVESTPQQLFGDGFQVGVPSNENWMDHAARLEQQKRLYQLRFEVQRESLPLEEVLQKPLAPLTEESPNRPHWAESNWKDAVFDPQQGEVLPSERNYGNHSYSRYHCTARHSQHYLHNVQANFIRDYKEYVSTKLKDSNGQELTGTVSQLTAQPQVDGTKRRFEASSNQPSLFPSYQAQSNHQHHRGNSMSEDDAVSNSSDSYLQDNDGYTRRRAQAMRPPLQVSTRPSVDASLSQASATRTQNDSCPPEASARRRPPKAMSATTASATTSDAGSSAPQSPVSFGAAEPRTSTPSSPAAASTAASCARLTAEEHRRMRNGPVAAVTSAWSKAPLAVGL